MMNDMIFHLMPFSSLITNDMGQDPCIGPHNTKSHEVHLPALNHPVEDMFENDELPSELEMEESTHRRQACGGD